MNAQDIKKVGIVATGVIGSSWAVNFAMKGFQVSVYDISQEMLDKAKGFVQKNLDYMISKNLMTKEQEEQTLANMSYSTDPAVALSDVQFIQESGPENYDIKRSMLATMEEFAPVDAIIASSSSGCLVTEMARDAKHPERVIVGHPYNPPHLIPLVDVCGGEKTSKEVVQTTFEFYQLMGKEPVIVEKEVPGYIANRLQMGLLREAYDLVHRGVCSIESVDKALTFGPGLRWALMGINLSLQLSGGEGGIKKIWTDLEPGWNLWLEDMADWHKFPDPDWPDKVQEGVNEEMAHRDPKTGNTNDEIIKWRDDRLIEILKMHDKL